MLEKPLASPSRTCECLPHHAHSLPPGSGCYIPEGDCFPMPSSDVATTKMDMVDLPREQKPGAAERSPKKLTPLSEWGGPASLLQQNVRYVRIWGPPRVISPLPLSKWILYCRYSVILFSSCIVTVRDG